MRRLILVRHAESEANARQTVTSAPPGPGLTEHGREQAAALVQRFAGARIRAIRCSPAARARDTARPLAEHLGIVPEEFPDLLEISCGDLEGQHSPEALATVVDVYNAWFDGRRTEIIPGGETYDEVERRMLRALPGAEEIPEDGAVLVVAHGGSLRVGVSGLAGEDVASGGGFLANAAHLTLTVDPFGRWTLAEAPTATVDV